MATKFLRQIILEEIKKVLSEDLSPDELAQKEKDQEELRNRIAASILKQDEMVPDPDSPKQLDVPGQSDLSRRAVDQLVPPLPDRAFRH